MLPANTPPSEYVGSESPEEKPHSLAKEPCYVHFKQIVDYTPNVEIKKGAWVVDHRQGNQGTLAKVGRKRGSRGLFGWFDFAGRKKIVALKFLVAVPAAYAFLRSKKDGKWYKLAPSTTGVMAKMFQVLKPVRLAPTTSDGPTACDDNPSGSQSEVPVEKTRLLRSSARSKVPAEKKTGYGRSSACGES